MARQLALRRFSVRALGTRQPIPYKVIALADGTILHESPAPGATYTRADWPPRGRGRGESFCSPRIIEARLRAQRAIELYAQGLTWQQIARRLGYRDKSGPWRAVRRAVDRQDLARVRRAERRRA